MDKKNEFLEHYKELLHEIKSPVDIIRAHALYIKNSCDMDRDCVEEYLSIILDETERLYIFLKDVDESIRSVELRVELCDINDIVKDVTKKLKYLFDDKHVKLKQNLKKDMPDIFVDKQKMFQVLINLMSNAIQSVEPGGTVEISTDINELFYLKVKDDGRGIKKAEMKKIFEPFYTTKPKGTGLGLYIIKNIVDAHGGSINVASVHNKGTEFLIILPTHLKE